tara:strand:+ start:4117 stop:4554 length:438 start_codon:yes stop_codon:yes gene_type:complete
MNTKIGFLLLLVLLIILMLFYYIDLESNIIILLAVVIVLVLHNLITKKEHFGIKEDAVALDSKLDTLISIAEALGRTSTETSNNVDVSKVQFTSSCPASLDATIERERATVVDTNNATNDKYNFGVGKFHTSIINNLGLPNLGGN